MTKTTAVRATLQSFYDGYQIRDIPNLSTFMELFSKMDDLEMIGISATKPGAYEWFSGRQAIEEIIESDWTYWGNVDFEVENAKITVNGDTAWFSTYGTLEQTDEMQKSMGFFKDHMKELIDKDEGSASDQMFEAVHFGIRRLLELNRGPGYKYPLVITGILVFENEAWRFHTLHWSMPVD